jgi:PBSX family phage terminase large subunit
MSETTVQIPLSVYLPKYRHLVDSTADINFLYGGRDSGKSHFIAQKLIEDCLRLPYFRCLLIKKTYNSIGESQWRTIKDIVEAWGISHLFTFRTAPLSIECVNGNRFLARGCDDPQSIKSVKDPSHAWYEEGNMLTLDDFITVTTTLRTNRARIQQWFSFNPECDVDYEEFWLYKTFFKGNALNGTHKWTLALNETDKFEYNYSVTHSTYHDNPYCTGERKIFLEQLRDIDPYYYQVYTLGQWGRRQNNAPFVFAFDRAKHLGKTTLNRSYEAILSFDFNRNPLCCTVWQNYNNHIYCIEAIKLANSDIYKMCDYIKIKYPQVLWVVTGDATGRASTAMVQNGMHYYTIIKNQLNLSAAQLKVPTVNPPVKESQVLINAVLYNVPTTIDPDNCKGLIFDFENVRILPDGSIEKKDRNDPAQQSDFLDTARYFVQTFHRHVLKT